MTRPADFATMNRTMRDLELPLVRCQRCAAGCDPRQDYCPNCGRERESLEPAESWG